MIRRLLEPVGAAARVTITKVMRTTYRLEWEFDGVKLAADYEPTDGDPEFEPDRRMKVRTFFNRRAAYRAAAIRLIFSKRDKLATGREGFKAIGCRACDVAPHDPEEPPQCRYHGGDGFETLVERLAAWLMWRDARRDAP
jgi:hypothetical protein